MLKGLLLASVLLLASPIDVGVTVDPEEYTTWIEADAEAVTDSSSTSSSDEEGNVNVSTDVNVDVTTNVYINLPYFTPSVTIIRSVNNKMLHRYYNPLYSEIPDYKGQISMNESIGIVYDGYFDVSYAGVTETDKISRELETLGYDFLLADESFDFIDGRWVHNVVECGEYVTRGTALMNLYKALGTIAYTMDYKCLPDETLKLEDSPFVSLITVPIDDINKSKAKTELAITRTDADRYWSRAHTEGIIKTKLNGSADKAARAEIITLGEFCILAQQMLYYYGEPVLTTEETNYLMEVYGKDLPYYLPQSQLESIKYLIVRGIVLPTDDFGDNLSLNDMLTILMRIKDEESRQTFKNIVLTYDAMLLSNGYYPTTVSVSDISFDAKYVYTGVSTANTYDYFVRKLNKVTTRYYYLEDGTEVEYTPYVELPENYTGSGMSIYQGVEKLGYQEFYHFKIPIDIGNETTPIKIRLSDTYYYTVNWGGGIYRVGMKTGDTYLFELGASFDTYGGSNPLWVDVTTQQKAVEEIRNTASVSDHKIYLSSSMKNTILFTFNGTFAQLREVKLDGETLLDRDGVTYTPSTEFATTYTLTVENVSDISTFLSKLELPATTSTSSRVVEAFGKEGDTYLVNTEYLKEKGILKSVEKIDDTRNFYKLISARNNIYIDDDNHRIIVGNTVYEVPADELLLIEKNGVMFINYKAAMGWTTTVLSISDVNGNVILNTDTNSVSGILSIYDFAADITTYNSTLRYADSSITIQSFVQTINGVNYNTIPLTALYPLSNYILYRDIDETNGAVDYLFTFKLSDVDVDDTAARTILADITGITGIPEGWVVLYSKDLDEQGLNYVDGIGYCYTVPEKTTELLNKYINNEWLMPFMTSKLNDGKSRVYNFNVNQFAIDSPDYAPMGQIPVTFVFKNSYSVDTVNYWDVYNNKLVTVTGANANPVITMRSAPTGIINKLLNMEKVTYAQYSYVYYGTLKLKTSVYNNKLNFTVSGKQLNLLDTPTTIDKVFEVLMETGLGTRYLAYSRDNFVFNTEETIIETDIVLEDSTYTSLTDWYAKSMTQAFSSIDSVLTLLLVIVSRLLPLILVYLTIASSALALLARNKIVIKFCENVFDIYKVLTFGKKNVYSINPLKLFVASIVAVGIFGMIYNGMIVYLFYWVGEGITGVFRR